MVTRGVRSSVQTGSLTGSVGSQAGVPVMMVKADAASSGVPVPEGLSAEVARLVELAQFEGVQLTREDGLMPDMIKQAVKAALQGEMVAHLDDDDKSHGGDARRNSILSRGSTTHGWTAALNQLEIIFPGRLPAQI
jgi:hypothetical protein